MNIVTEREINGRLSDGINTLLNLTEEDFQKVIDLLQITRSKRPDTIRFFYSTDKCEAPDEYITLGLEEPRNSRYYIGVVPSMPEIFEELSLRVAIADEKSDESLRSIAILETRNIEALKKEYFSINADNMELLNRLFEVLENPDILKKFLDYDNNSEYFSVGKNGATIQDYFKLLGDIFGTIDENGNFKNQKDIVENFFIPNLDSIIRSVKDIYQRYNVDRYIDPRYEFRSINFNEIIFRDGDEPEWTIRPELYDAVYKDMPEDLSIEEKALYIYTKLCSVLEYDEEFFYRGKGISSIFVSNSSKELLEKIVPNSKLTCFEFSRILAKMINEIEGNIEAVVILQGQNPGHCLAGFYTDEISARLEAVNINTNGIKNSTNDLTKAKNGIKLQGITAQSDRTGIIEKAMDKVYESIYGKKPVSIKSFVEELNNLPKTNIPADIKLKLQSFIEVMQEKGIVGNEFVQTLDEMYKANFFGNTLEKTYLGKRFEHDGKSHIQRMVLFRQKGNGENEEPLYYLLDTSTLEITEPTAQQLIEELNSNHMIYENEKYKMAGIDKGGK